MCKNLCLLFYNIQFLKVRNEHSYSYFSKPLKFPINTLCQGLYAVYTADDAIHNYLFWKPTNDVCSDYYSCCDFDNSQQALPLSCLWQIRKGSNGQDGGGTDKWSGPVLSMDGWSHCLIRTAWPSNHLVQSIVGQQLFCIAITPNHQVSVFARVYKFTVKKIIWAWQRAVVWCIQKH